MTVAVTINVGLFPYGNPGSVGEPLGILAGTVIVTGDASGGFVQVVWVVQNPTTNPTLADQRRQYVFFIDDFRTTVNADPGNVEVNVFAHFDRPNVALGPPFTHIEVSDMIVGANGVFHNSLPWLDGRTSRLPIFWAPRELADNIGNIAEVNFQNNVDTKTYRVEVLGRYYDHGILSQRGFGRLIAPPALTQFEG